MFRMSRNILTYNADGQLVNYVPNGANSDTATIIDADPITGTPQPDVNAALRSQRVNYRTSASGSRPELDTSTPTAQNFRSLKLGLRPTVLNNPETFVRPISRQAPPRVRETTLFSEIGYTHEPTVLLASQAGLSASLPSIADQKTSYLGNEATDGSTAVFPENLNKVRYPLQQPTTLTFS